MLFLTSLILTAIPAIAQFNSGAEDLTEPELIDRAWHLSTKLGGNALVGVSGGSTLQLVGNAISDASAFIIDDGPNDNQWWTADVRWFHIRSLSTGAYLTVQGDSPGSAVGLAPLIGGSGENIYKQQFRLVVTGQLGWYKLRSRLSQTGPDLVLEIDGDGKLIVGDPDPDPAAEQKFAFNLAMPDNPATRYCLVSTTVSHFLSDNGISTVGTDAVHIKNSNESVVWNLQPAGSGYYYVFNELTKHYLAIPTDGGNSVIMSNQQTDEARWSLERFNHAFRLKNKKNGHYLAINNHTASGHALYTIVNSGGSGGINWSLHRMPTESSVFPGDYQRIESGTENPLCVVFGPSFQKALAERVGLSPDVAYFPVIRSAIAARYGAARVDEILKKIDLGNAGHRVDLALMFRKYISETLPSIPRNNWTPIEEQAVAEIEEKIRLLRIDYANRVETAWHEYENNYANSGTWGVSILLTNITADDFVWPALYPTSNIQADMMYDYMVGSVTFDERNVLIVGGTFIGVSVGYAMANVAIGTALYLALEEAALLGTSSALYAVVAGAGPVIAVAAVAAAVIAMKVMEYQALQELLDDIDQTSVWANQPVSLNNTLNAPDLLARLRILNDLDYVIGSPVPNGFQYNFNDNEYQAPFSLSCLNNPTVDLDENGHVNITPFAISHSLIAPLCGGDAVFELSQTQFDCSDLGQHPVTLNVHNSVYSQSCTAMLTVRDQIPPAITCKNATLFLGASGNATVTYSDVYQGGNDNCGFVTPQSISQTSLNCSQLGANTLTVTAHDGHGNTGSCNAVVTVTDNTPPVVNCKNGSVFLGANGTATVNYADVFQNGSDNCGLVTPQSISQTVFGCGSLGANTVTFTANDGHGNSATCNSVVNVVDNLPPTLVCKNKTLSLNAGGTATLLMSDVFQSGTDNCGIVNQVSVAPNTFNCNNLGTNTVTLTANDGHGNSGVCTASVTIEDHIAPVMLCKPATLALNAAGQATLVPAQLNNGSYDNCGIGFLSLNKSVFTCADLGNNSVSLEGVDQSNNKALCYASVTIVDGISPQAKCKNLSVNLGANGAVSVTPSQINNGSSDNCSFNLTLTPNTFNCANIGSSTVVLRATDMSGNSASCTALLTVKDASAPAALCKNATVFLNSNGVASLGISQVDNGSNDNCGISTKTLNLAEFSCAELSGSWTVTMTVKDFSNNIGTCNSSVTVKDALAPTPVCENTVVHLGANGMAVVYPANLAGDSYDNCSVWSYSPTAKVYTTANLGNNNLNITVKDFSNNAATCTAVVTVLPFSGSNNLQQQEDAEQAEVALPAGLRLFPNPGSEVTHAVFQLPLEQAFRIRVYDMAGRLVYEREGMGTAGENLEPLNLNGIAVGVYSVDFQSDGLKDQKRLLIQR